MTQADRRVSTGKMKVSIKVFTRNLTPIQNIKINTLYSKMTDTPEYKEIINKFNKEAREIIKKENEKEGM
jgi:hypothetical protein